MKTEYSHSVSAVHLQDYGSRYALSRDDEDVAQQMATLASFVARASHLFAVALCTEKELRWPIPSRHYSGMKHTALIRQRRRVAEVAQLHDSVTRDQHVLWLHILRTQASRVTQWKHYFE